MAQDAADQGASQRRGHVDVAALALDLLTLDPAALTGGGEHGPHGRDRGFEEPLALATPAVVDRRRWGWRVAVVVDAAAAFDGAHG